MARGMGFSSVVLFLLVFAVALGVFVVLRHGVSARDEPTKAEIFVARRLRHLAIPIAARNMASPLSATPQTVKAGMEHFADHCATCHGNDGSGDTEIGKGLYPKAPDMRTEETQSLSDGELFYIIENGIRFTGMPGWGKGASGGEKREATDASDATGSDSSHDTWALVHFIRHLPKLTDDEVAQMKALNPKSPEEWEQEQQMREFLKGGDTSAPPVESGGHSHEHEHGKPAPPPAPAKPPK
jgi:mono/diheme cytochrome c family protein